MILQLAKETLSINDDVFQHISYENKETMLNNEIAKIKNTIPTSAVRSSQIVLRILNDIDNNLNPEDSHNQTCHSKSHGQTNGGGGFSKSYTKKC